MEKLIATRLYSVIADSLSGKGTPGITEGNIDILWREFADTVASAGSENCSTTTFLRELYLLRAELRHSHLLAIEREDLHCVGLIEKVLSTIESEIELINLGMRFPNLDSHAKIPGPALYIADGFSRTDLVEIIKSLHAVRFSRRRDGAYATLADLTGVLGGAFNADISRVGQKIHNTVNRMKGPAQFLLKLVDTLEEISKR